MRPCRRLATIFTAMLLCGAIQAAEVLVEAEGFAERGGWVVDPQFMEQMGSPYLLAHGLGKPVANAKTEAEFPAPGSYRLWVRTMDWVPSHHPGRFKVVVAGTEIAATFGERVEHKQHRQSNLAPRGLDDETTAGERHAPKTIHSEDGTRRGRVDGVELVRNSRDCRRADSLDARRQSVHRRGL